MRALRLSVIAAAVATLAISHAHADRVYPAWVIPDTLIVRSGPGADRDRIGTLSRGTKVHVTAFANNWCWAKLPDGRWGWVAEWLLQFSADRGRRLAEEAGASSSSGGTSTTHPPAWIEPEAVNVRSGPGTHYDRRGQLTRGDKVYVIKSERGWYKCRTPGGYGWIRRDLLERDIDRGRQLARAGRTEHTTQSTDVPTAKAYVNGDGVRLRSGPGTDFSIKNGLSRGQTIHVTEHRGEWYRVRVHGGQDGWIHEALVKLEGGSDGGSSGGDAAKGYVNGSRVHLRAGPSLNEHIRAKVVRGQVVYITERLQDWYHVRVHGGDEGWIHASLVKLEGEAPSSGDAEATAKGFVAGSRVHLRAGPGTDQRIKSLVVEGQTLYVTERRGEWCRVRVHGGEDGWIHASLVKFAGEEQPAAPSMATTQVEDLVAWIGEDVVNVRYGPGTDHEVKFKLSRGTQVRMLELSGHWCKISDDESNVGWVAGWVMNFKGPGEDPTATEGATEVPVRTAWVARPEVNLRSGPGTDHPEVAEAVLGTEVIILDREGDWYRVVLDNGETGYMASWLLDTRAQRRVRQAGEDVESAPPPAPSSEGQAFVNTAMQYLGCPYVRGGSSPGGFDCSGFVSYVMRRHGIQVSRSSLTLYHEGTPISRSQLQPGDVVFFRNTYRAGISHVGIYIGGGEFIHASNRRSDVKISSLDSAYYAPRYAGARRMH